MKTDKNGIPEKKRGLLFLKNPYSEQTKPTEFLAAKMIILSLAYLYLYENPNVDITPEFWETAKTEQLSYLTKVCNNFPPSWGQFHIRAFLNETKTDEELKAAEEDENLMLANHYADFFGQLGDQQCKSIQMTVYHFNRKPVSVLEQTYNSLICP